MVFYCYDHPLKENQRDQGVKKGVHFCVHTADLHLTISVIKQTNKKEKMDIEWLHRNKSSFSQLEISYPMS